MTPQALLALGIPKLLVVFIISASPLVELRGALPVAINLFYLPWLPSFLVSFLGNLLPVPFLLLFLNSMLTRLGRVKVCEGILSYVLARTTRRGGFVEKYKRIGLILFVAIPFPGTGAWTGSLIAVLLGLKFRNSFLSILLGVFIAGVVVTALCLLGWIGAIIAGVALASITVIGLWKRLS